MIKFIGIFVITFAMLLTGCPSTKNIADAKKTSHKLAVYANTGINVTRDLYQKNLLSPDPQKNLAIKDKIATGFIALSQAGQEFDKAVLDLEAQYGTNAPPQTEMDKLAALFDAEIVAKLVQLLKTIGRSNEKVN